MSLYHLLRWMARLFLPLMADYRVEGLENVPSEAPFILVLNHQSVLDPVVTQSICPRVVHAMTKSTQFASPVFRWLLPRVHTLPTRRYRVDPQVVRVALRVLGEGGAVGIYAEGERSWDGRLQPFRRGTIRLLLKAGVQIVPCAIEGTYGVVPRWSRKLRRGRVVVRFGKPLHFGKHDDRAEREAALPDATRRLREAIEDLGIDPVRRLGPEDVPEWPQEHSTGFDPASRARTAPDEREVAGEATEAAGSSGKDAGRVEGPGA